MVLHGVGSGFTGIFIRLAQKNSRDKQTNSFCPYKYIQSSFLFASKTRPLGAYHSVENFKGASLRQTLAPGFTCINKNSKKKKLRDKHSSLFFPYKYVQLSPTFASKTVTLRAYLSVLKAASLRYTLAPGFTRINQTSSKILRNEHSSLFYPMTQKKVLELFQLLESML